MQAAGLIRQLICLAFRSPHPLQGFRATNWNGNGFRDVVLWLFFLSIHVCMCAGIHPNQLPRKPHRSLKCESQRRETLLLKDLRKLLESRHCGSLRKRCSAFTQCTLPSFSTFCFLSQFQAASLAVSRGFRANIDVSDV